MQDGGNVTSAEVAVVSVAGGVPTRLTFNAAWEYGVSWSPDGQWLVFGSKQDGTWQLYLMHPAGSNRTRLESGGGNAPAWSPDGRTIAFTSDRAGNDNIYVMDAGGGNVRRLTTGASHHDNAVWTPDGRRLAFNSDRDGVNDLVVMDADGG
jgi:Tol biopolymer transport system component